ncbi:DUF2909 domain-containing protein [Algicola sagamiensis]|uniref:DUF2909 domain-containing protein n=1 Tax=Algicola sagamiensis TaxID=163869 RepID=UPI000360E6FE|nr:DUF2909 domain-containing protein [Algicola sagamiensis]
MNIIKLVLIALLLMIIVNLFKALLVFTRNETKTSMSQFLGKRVLFSALVIVILLLSVASGLITPNPSPF